MLPSLVVRGLGLVISVGQGIDIVALRIVLRHLQMSGSVPLPRTREALHLVRRR